MPGHCLSCRGFGTTCVLCGVCVGCHPPKTDEHESPLTVLKTFVRLVGMEEKRSSFGWHWQEFLNARDAALRFVNAEGGDA
jgi:hypothetical protein